MELNKPRAITNNLTLSKIKVISQTMIDDSDPMDINRRIFTKVKRSSTEHKESSNGKKEKINQGKTNKPIYIYGPKQKGPKFINIKKGTIFCLCRKSRERDQHTKVKLNEKN